MNSATEQVTEVIIEGMNLNIPMRSKSHQKYPAWFSAEFRYYLREKLHYRRIYKKTGTVLLYTKYSICRNLTKRLYRCDRNRHLKNVEQGFMYNAKYFWNHVNEHVKKRVTTSHVLFSNGAPLASPTPVSQMFADHFSSSLAVSSRVITSIPEAVGPFLSLCDIDVEEICVA